jgi:hypothetical protein
MWGFEVYVKIMALEVLTELYIFDLLPLGEEYHK